MGTLPSVFATSNTIASAFDELDVAGWLITSYALGMCASQPIVRLPKESGRALINV
jgi:hypothetical protein